ncbi:MAG: hypothetical protein J6A75_07070 [Lachnospiraceae bacterium]|nr:hypothetical protein [Lachnospiraceae bacterium]
MADKFLFRTPKGEMYKIKTPDGETRLEIRWNSNFGPNISKTFNSVQEFIDSRCLELCEPLIPKDTGILKESGILCTQIGSGEVKYRTPYARRWYYMPASFSEGSGSGMYTKGRGNYWFERMKQQHKEQILKGAQRIANGG